MGSTTKWCVFLIVIAFVCWVGAMHATFTNKDVREYQSTFRFQETNCSVQGAVDHGRTLCEYMADVYYYGYKKMEAKYGAKPAQRSVHGHHPCIEVVVRYHDSEGIIRNGTLYQNSTALLSDKGQHCSFADCGPNEKTTKEQVQANLYQLSKASIIKCYYNTKDHSQVIVSGITYSQVLSSVWLDAFISLVGCVVLLVLLIVVLVVLIKGMVKSCICNIDKVQGNRKVPIKERYSTLTTNESV